MKEKLRIGILLDNFEIPAWSFEMVSQVENSLSCEIVLIIKNKTKEPENSVLIKELYQKSKNLIYTLYRKLDRKYFKANPDAFEPKNIHTLLNVDVLKVKPLKINLSQYFDRNDINKIKKYNIDIFVKLGFKKLDGDILKVSKYGIWAYHHGDIKFNRGVPHGFWEVMEKWDVTGVALQMLSDGFNRVLFKSTCLTDNLSVERSINNCYWKAVSFLPRKLEELFRLGESDFFNRIDKLNEHPDFYYSDIKSIPSNRIAIVKLIKFKWRRIRNIIRGFFYFDQWILLYNLEEFATISSDLSHFKKITPPKDRFWADPHIIKKNDKYYIFIEELIYSNNKGFISVIEMDKNGNYSSPVKVLEESYHLSFPFIIEDEGDVYMIPESKENKNIQLYKCIDFPYTWKLEKVLIDNVMAVDSVVFYRNGKYWLFTNIVKNKGASANDELFLYWSDNLVSNHWISHPENPIISDVKSARMAGGLFSHNRNLYRPSQNCSKHYGYGMKINQVLEINDTKYIEKTVDSIYPNWDKKIKAAHSISYVDHLTVIDAKFTRTKY